MKTIYAVIVTGVSAMAIVGGGVGTASAAGAFNHTTTIVERVAAPPAPLKVKPSPTASARTSPPKASVSDASPSEAIPQSATPSQAPSPSASPPQTLPPVLVVGEDYTGMRPTMVDPSGDGNGAVTGITWSQWDSAEAVGYGYQRHNDCEPDCAEGTMTYSPVEIVLGGVTGNSSADGGRYTTIAVTGTDGSEDMAWGAGPMPVAMLQSAAGGEQGNY